VLCLPTSAVREDRDMRGIDRYERNKGFANSYLHDYEASLDRSHCNIGRRVLL